MDKKPFLDKLFYEFDKQQGNLELAHAYLDKEGNPKFSKWVKYLEAQSNDKFILKVNNRTILRNEIVLDIEEPERFSEILEKVKKEFEFYSAYKTGSKGYHIHLWFSQDLTQEEKLYVIKEYECDEQKASNRCMIALENVPHWKTGNNKELIEEKIGFNKKPENKYINILKNPNLLELINKEFNKKIEGEEPTKKAIFLSLCSIWVDGSEVPLNTLVSSESSAGKSFICKNIVKIFPKELVEYRTKITPEAFTYWHYDEPEWTWDGKICYLEDISQSILDAPTFKVMCSEGSTATIVIRQKAVDIEIQGKPVILVTTARTNPNVEILNRFQIVSLNESKEQTKAIVFRQAKQKNNEPYDEKITKGFLFLRRKKVFIPFAEKIAEFLDKNYSFENLRLRRDFTRLLDLIKCSAVLHQYQREENEKGELIAEEQDYKIAREVINYIQTQTFRGLTHRLKKAFDCCKKLEKFTAKEIHSKFPFVNQKMWYLYLDKLLERGMLKTELIKTEEAKQKVTYFSINEDKSFTLPEFSHLPKIITNLTKVTNDKDKDGTNVSNVTNVIKKANQNIDFSELDGVFKDG